LHPKSEEKEKKGTEKEKKSSFLGLNTQNIAC
jgi:hypothetical protein